MSTASRTQSKTNASAATTTTSPLPSQTPTNPRTNAKGGNCLEADPGAPGTSRDVSRRFNAADPQRNSFASSELGGCPLLQAAHNRRLPRAVEDGLIGPIGPEPNRKISCRSRYPVGLLVSAGRFHPEVNGQRAVRIVFQRFVLRAEREPIDSVRGEDVFGVIDRQ